MIGYRKSCLQASPGHESAYMLEIGRFCGLSLCRRNQALYARLSALIVLLIISQSAQLWADQSDVAERILNNRLNNLESQAVQRQGRERRTQDLLVRQDDKIARQALNSLKTRRLRSTAVPLLEQKFSRSRGALRPFDRR